MIRAQRVATSIHFTVFTKLLAHQFYGLLNIDVLREIADLETRFIAMVRGRSDCVHYANIIAIFVSFIS